MSLYPENNGYNDWYQPVDPRENIYTVGYGWSPKPPHIIELQMISRSAVSVVLCLIAFMFLESYIYNTLITFCQIVLPIQMYGFFGAVEELVLIATQIVAVLIPFSLYAMYVKIPLHCALPIKNVSAGVILSALFVCLAATVLSNRCADSVYMLFDALGLHFYDSLSDMPTQTLETVLYCINVVLVSPVIEEIAFRGFLMQSLRRFGDSFALVVSAVLFGMLHSSPASMLYAVFMGLVMGYFVLFTGSLHTSVTVHFVNNLLAVVFSALAEFYPDGTYLISASLDVAYLVLGILSVIWLTARYENIFSLASSKTVNRSTAKIRRFFLSIPFAVFALAALCRAWSTLL